MEQLASVAVGRPVKGPFTYLVPPELEGRLQRGQRVLVPFGGAGRWASTSGPGSRPRGARCSSRSPPCSRTRRRCPTTCSRWWSSPRRTTATRSARRSGPRSRRAWPTLPRVRSRAPTWCAPWSSSARPRSMRWRRAPAQAATLGYLLAVGGRAELDELGRAVPGARAAVQRLRRAGLGRGRGARPRAHRGRGARTGPAGAAHRGAGERRSSSCRARSTPAASSPSCSRASPAAGRPRCTSARRSTRSRRGGGALVLVPEIALTPQLVGRFRSRFGSAVAVLHSGLRDRERLLHWKGLRSGAVRLAVGRALRGVRPGEGPCAPGGGRGARPVVQAGREAPLPGARPGGGAGQAGRGHGGARLGHARRWRRWRTRGAAATGACGSPRGWTTGRCPRWSWWTCGACARGRRACPSSRRALARRWSTPWARRSAGASRPSSSSTAAATRRRWSARPAARASPAAAATSRSPSTSGPATSSATTAARAGPCPTAARRAAGRCCRWARAPSASRPRSPSASRAPGWPGSTATRPPPPSG